MAAQLLEREAELAVLNGTVAAAGRDGGSFVLISGEAGIGKTSLLSTFVDGLDAGVRVLSGVCDDLATPRTLGPFHDMARKGAKRLRDALGSQQHSVLFPSVLAELDDPLATVIVTIEDVHWADDGTLDVLRFLARRLESLHAVVILTFRSDEIDEQHGLRRVLAALPRTRTQRIELRGLSREAVRALTQDAGLSADELLAVTGGNPFYVTEVVATAETDVPPTVADAVLARVSHLSAAAQAALQVLCVIPSHVETWLVDELVEGAPGVIVEAEARGLLQVSAERVSFRHELARRALEASLPSSAALQHHRLVLAALQRHGGADLSRILHHAVPVGDVDVILAHGPTAAREAAAAGAHREALAHYRQVLRHADRLDAATRATVHEEAAWELGNAHRFRDGAEQGRLAVQHREALGDPVALAVARVSLSRLLYLANRPQESLQTVEQAVADARRGNDVGAQAVAEVWHGGVLQLLDRSHDAIAVLERAQALAERAGRRELVALALNYLGGSRSDLDDPEGVSLLERSIVIAKEVDHQEHAVRGYANIAQALAYFADYDRLRRYVPEGLAYAHERDFAAHEYVLEAHRCLLLVVDGQWSEAERELRRLVASVDEPGNTGRFSLPLLAQLAARRGADDARDVIDAAWRNGTRGDAIQSLVLAAAAGLEWAWLSGDHAVGVERTQVALDRLERVAGRARYRGELARWMHRLGVAVDAGTDVPEEFAAAIRGDWESAAAAWERVGDPYARALELADSGEREPMFEALTVLDQLGATAVARLVRARLRAMGVKAIPRGPQVRTRENPAKLTAREMDVLALLSAGATNTKIAQQLVVSVRTVDHHVSALLQKLAVSSRHEAVGAARAMGIIDENAQRELLGDHSRPSMP